MRGFSVKGEIVLFMRESWQYSFFVLFVLGFLVVIHLVGVVSWSLLVVFVVLFSPYVRGPVVLRIWRVLSLLTLIPTTRIGVVTLVLFIHVLMNR